MSHLRLTASLLILLAHWLVGFPSAARGAINVLFIVADDLNCSISPYGDAIAMTPNMERLAASGLVFKRAYCQQAVCNPSRSSFLTGIRPDKVGVDDLRKYFRNTVPDGANLVTLPQHFKNHGYFCQDVGKIFHNMGETQDRASWSIDEVFYKGTHAADTVFSNRPILSGSPVPADQERDYKAPVTESFDVPDIVYRDGQIASLVSSLLTGSADRSIAKIGRHGSHDPMPFFLAVGFWRPHLPFVAPKRYWDLYQPAAIPAPDPASPPSDVPAIAIHDSREIRGYGNVPKDRDWTDEEVRHWRHGYYAAISFLDAQLGRILDALDASGLAERTVIVLTSDHGFHIGEHGLWGKTSNFELDARVPLIIASPMHPESHGKSTDALVELIDLFPTLAALANIDQDLPEHLDGVSLLPLLKDPSASVKDAAMTEHQQPFYGGEKNWLQHGRSIRTERWRYTQWESITDRTIKARELYDHEEDPYETRNLAGQERYQSTVTELEHRLRAMQQLPR